MKKEKAIIKFNGGLLALLCSNCRTIVKIGQEFTEKELQFAQGKLKHLDPLFCEKCKKSKYPPESNS